MAFTASQDEEVEVEVEVDVIDEVEVAVIDVVEQEQNVKLEEEVDYGGATDVEGFQPPVTTADPDKPDKAEDADMEERSEKHPPTSCLS